MTSRRGGVHASNYVLHVPASDRTTLCGRACELVNCQPLSEGITEATCRGCAAYLRRRRADDALDEALADPQMQRVLEELAKR